MATSQPACANFRAMARPMPREPPVTKAFLSASWSFITIFLSAGLWRMACPVCAGLNALNGPGLGQNASACRNRARKLYHRGRLYHASIAQVLRILFNVLLLFTGLPLWAQTRAEFHGLWVDAFGPGFLTSDQVKGLAQDCRKYNFNAVIVEMRRRGDAFYTPHPPNPDPRTSVLAEDFDALAEIIHECHSMTPRIEVHCWLVSHFIWSWKNPPPQKNHIFNLHPEYLTKDSIGQKQIAKGYYLDPGHPDANQWIHDVAVDIVVRYGIDGIHWDYCRYPEEESGYNEKAIGRYNAEF